MRQVDHFVIRAAALAFRRARGRAIDRLRVAIEAARAAAPLGPRTYRYWDVSERFYPLSHDELWEIHRGCVRRVHRDAQAARSWTQLAMLLSRPGEHVSTERWTLSLPTTVDCPLFLAQYGMHPRWRIRQQRWPDYRGERIVPTQRGDLLVVEHIVGSDELVTATLSDTTRKHVRAERATAQYEYECWLKKAADALAGGKCLSYWPGQNGGVIVIRHRDVSAHGVLRRLGLPPDERGACLDDAQRTGVVRLPMTYRGRPPAELRRDDHADADPHAVRRDRQREAAIVAERYRRRSTWKSRASLLTTAAFAVALLGCPPDEPPRRRCIEYWPDVTNECWCGDAGRCTDGADLEPA